MKLPAQLCSRIVFILIMTLLLFAGYACKPEERVPIEGDWQGHVSIRGKERAIFVHFSIDNALSASIDIPEQGASHVPLSKISLAYPKLSLELESDPNTVRFDSSIVKGKIAGNVTQGNAAGTFVLERVDETLVREAKKVLEESVSLDAATGKLAGTLSIPEEAGPFPSILIVDEMGPADRDGNSIFSKTKTNSIKKLAEALARAGIASLRYDRRGIGESAAAIGKTSELRFKSYVDDAVGFLDLLKKDSRFFIRGVLAHGDGLASGVRAVIASKADFFIAIGSPLKPQSAIVLDRYKATLDAKTFLKAKAVVGSLLSGKTVKDVDPALARYFPKDMQPFLISWLNIDPAIELAKLVVPSLIVAGGADPVVSVAEEQSLSAANRKARFAAIPGMNHSFFVRPEKKVTGKADTVKEEGSISSALIQSIFLFVAQTSIPQSPEEK
jgi:uncharacterized protein